MINKVKVEFLTKSGYLSKILFGQGGCKARPFLESRSARLVDAQESREQGYHSGKESKGRTALLHRHIRHAMTA